MSTKRGSLQSWKLIPNARIIAYAKAYCKEHGIKKLSELGKGSSLMSALERRKIQKEVLGRESERVEILAGQEFRLPLHQNGYINWQSIPDIKTVAYARAYCKEYGINRIGALFSGRHKNTGLARRLNNRKLKDQIFTKKSEKIEVLAGRAFTLPLDKKEGINWKSMTNREIIAYAKAYCEHNRINRISELNIGQKKHGGLSNVLMIRKLQDQVFPREKEKVEVILNLTFKLPLDSHGNINWQSMSDKEIVTYAKAYCKEHDITKISELRQGQNKHTGLAAILISKKLQFQVFSKSIPSLSDLATALEKFE